MRLRVASIMMATLPLHACGDHPDIPAGAEGVQWDDLELASSVQGVFNEELRIDGYAADLVPIGGVAVRRDGLIALSQPQDGVVRFFDEDGVDLGSFGARGEGPGEFSGMSAMGWRADSLWVIDSRLRRVTLMSPEAGLLRTVRVPDDVATERAGLPIFPFVTAVGLDPDGLIVVSMQLAAGQDVPASFRDQSVVARVDESGAISEIVSRIPIGRVQVNIPAGSVMIPFAHRPQWSLSPDGSLVAIAVPESLSGGEDASLSLRVERGENHTVFSRRLRMEGVEIPREVADAAIDGIVAGLGPELAAAFVQEAEVPGVYPPVDDLIVGGDRTIWIVVPHEEGGQLAHVSGSDGEYVGTLRLDEHTTLAAAEVDRIWVVEQDEFDVGSLVRYGVSW